MFLHVCDSVHRGGLQADPPNQTPPGPGRPPHPGPGRHPPRRLQHTVNEQPVRILLECILVTPVCHSVHMGVNSRGGGVCMRGCLNPGRVGQTLPQSTAISGQYASYWNASLFQKRMSFCPGGGDFPSGQRPTLPQIETSLPD